MSITLYNTLGRRYEEFMPLSPPRTYMFVCGPTVYDYSHLGHARTYIAFDTIAKYLRFRGYHLLYIMNITDIDDKILARAQDMGMEWREVADVNTREFFRDMESLNCDAVDFYAYATDHINEILMQIEALMKNGYAYESGGNVYYRTGKWEDMGKLSGQNYDELLEMGRVDDPHKEDPRDFALWKAHKEGEGAKWASPFGPGRPGWHIEDTAITVKYFGPQYDIHGGAQDLIFPHHEAEIAIAEAYSGIKPFVKYWLHTGLLSVKGEKMSKSLGNFLTVREALRDYKADVLRFFVLSHHYRSGVDYNPQVLEEASVTYERIVRFYMEMKDKSEDMADLEADRELMDGFVSAMDRDFNTREALAHIFSFMGKVRNAGVKGGRAAGIVRGMEQIFSLFGMTLPESRTGSAVSKGGVDYRDLVNLLLRIRGSLRAEKNYKMADDIRDKLLAMGIEIEDTKEGTTWRLK